MILKNFENKLRVTRGENYLDESNSVLVKFKKEEYEKMLFQIKAVQE